MLGGPRLSRGAGDSGLDEYLASSQRGNYCTRPIIGEIGCGKINEENQISPSLPFRAPPRRHLLLPQRQLCY
jgi:hypothetical protein